MLKNWGAQVVFSSILPVTGRDFGRNKQAQDVNTWLQDWWLQQNFVVLNHRRAFERQSMLGSDGIHLYWWEKWVFRHKLVGLIESALK